MIVILVYKWENSEGEYSPQVKMEMMSGSSEQSDDFSHSCLVLFVRGSGQTGLL